MKRIVDTTSVWTALQTRLAFLQAGRLLAPELLNEQLREEAVERSLAFMHVTRPEELASCPEEPTLVLVTGLERLAGTVDPQRCAQLSNWRAAVQDLLPRCGEARILLQSRVPKALLGGCPGSQLIVDATPAFLRPDPESLVAAAAEVSELPRSTIEQLAVWYGYRAGLVLAVVEKVDLAAKRNDLFAAAKDCAVAEYVAAFEELGPDVIATLDHYVTELKQEVVDFRELDSLLTEALRGAGFIEISDDGRTITLFPGRDGAQTRAILRTVVDSTCQLPMGYLQSVEKLWFIERTLRAEVRRLLVKRHGATDWTRRVPGPDELLRRLVSRAAQEAFPRAESCADLPNPLEWMTLGELVDMILDCNELRPFGVSDGLWVRMKAELAPVRDRIAHMRLLRGGDSELVGRWQRQIAKLQNP